MYNFKILIYCSFYRKEILEDAPPGSKLAVLIFREGEVINLLRVIENSDGSITNLKDSPRYVKNIYLFIFC